MIIFKTGLSKEEQKQVIGFLFEMPDLYGDFYITKSNLRIYIKDNPEVLMEDLKKGDKIAFDENGIAIIVGYSDKMPRKYLKILVKNLADVEKYLKVIAWNVADDLYIKIKKNNPLKDILLKEGFQFFGGRGREVLFMRKGERNVSNNPTKNKSTG